MAQTQNNAKQGRWRETSDRTVPRLLVHVHCWTRYRSSYKNSALLLPLSPLPSLSLGLRAPPLGPGNEFQVDEREPPPLSRCVVSSPTLLLLPSRSSHITCSSWYTCVYVRLSRDNLRASCIDTISAAPSEYISTPTTPPAAPACSISSPLALISPHTLHTQRHR